MGAKNQELAAHTLVEFRAFLRHRILVRRPVGDSRGACGFAARDAPSKCARATTGAAHRDAGARRAGCAARPARRRHRASGTTPRRVGMGARARQGRARASRKSLGHARRARQIEKRRHRGSGTANPGALGSCRRPRDRKRGARNRVVRRSPAARPRRRGVRSRKSADRRIGDRVRAAPARHCCAHHPGLRTGARARRLARQIRTHRGRIGRSGRRALRTPAAQRAGARERHGPGRAAAQELSPSAKPRSPPPGPRATNFRAGFRPWKRSPRRSKANCASACRR